MRVQRRCPRPLEEARLKLPSAAPAEAAALAEALADEALEVAARKAAALELERLLPPGQAQRSLREVVRLLDERAINERRDQAPPGPQNPNCCPWFAATGKPEARWLGVLRLGADGELLPLGLDPLHDPARYRDAGAIVLSERGRALRQQLSRSARPKTPTPKGKSK